MNTEPNPTIHSEGQYFVVAPRGIFVDVNNHIVTPDAEGFALKPNAKPIKLAHSNPLKADARAYAVAAEQCILPSALSQASLRDLLGVWSKEQLLLGFKASQLVRWQRDHKFCSRCGAATQFAEHQPFAVCTECHYKQYPRLQPCVIVAVVQRNLQGHITQILLAQSALANKPFRSLVAGFVEVGESLEQAVAREVYEETRLRVDNISYLGSQPWPFPSNIMIGFVADYAGGNIELADEELADAAFYDIDALPVIPPMGTIAHSIIMHLCQNQPLGL